MRASISVRYPHLIHFLRLEEGNLYDKAAPQALHIGGLNISLIKLIHIHVTDCADKKIKTIYYLEVKQLY